MYYVYILTNWTNVVIYIGVTDDLERRLCEHQIKWRPGFTSKYNVCKLVYYEKYKDVDAASVREKQLKKWRREKKNALVETMNPHWNDLSEVLGQRSLAALGMK